MIAQINMRKGTSAEWAAAAPVILLAGESGYDTTLKRYKVGDGETEWANLEWNTLWSRPVGSIYESTVSTSPATLFGGTWAAIGGRFLIGADGTYAAGSTGGEATHTLTAAELARHGHAVSMGTGSGAWFDPYTAVAGSNTGASLTEAWASGVTQEGGGGAHNNMPPYLVVYMWKRTA